MSKLAVLMSEHLVCVREFSHWWIHHEHFKGLLIYPLLGIGSATGYGYICRHPIKNQFIKNRTDEGPELV